MFLKGPCTCQCGQSLVESGASALGVGCRGQQVCAGPVESCSDLQESPGGVPWAGKPDAGPASLGA